MGKITEKFLLRLNMAFSHTATLAAGITAPIQQPNKPKDCVLFPNPSWPDQGQIPLWLRGLPTPSYTLSQS